MLLDGVFTSILGAVISMVIVCICFTVGFRFMERALPWSTFGRPLPLSWDATVGACTGC